MAKKRNRRKSTRHQTSQRLRSPFDLFLNTYQNPIQAILIRPVQDIIQPVPVKQMPVQKPTLQAKKKVEAKNLYLPNSIEYIDQRSNFCHSRKIRSEVLHALGKTGKSGQKKPDTSTSNIRC